MGIGKGRERVRKNVLKGRKGRDEQQGQSGALGPSFVAASERCGGRG